MSSESRSPRSRTNTIKTRDPLLSGRFGESGHLYFGANETDKRLMLCRDALCVDGGIHIKFKKIYASLLDMEHCSITEFSDVSQLHERYLELNQVANGGEFEKYRKALLPEGAMLPFVRVKGRTKLFFIDSGCVWLGNRFSYPRIFVDNSVAHWLSPFSEAGRVRTELFLQYKEITKIKHTFESDARYPDVQIDSYV